MIAAQALHWFDHPRFYAEAQRALAPAGLIAIIQNDRALDELPLFGDYESFLEEHSPGLHPRLPQNSTSPRSSPRAGFGDVSSTTAEWTRPQTHKEFIELARSSSKMHAAVEQLGEEETTQRLRALLEHHHPSGQLEIPYISTLFHRPAPMTSWV